ncbi:MAG TPA: COX15/CtaA family protein [Methylophilus sp.]|nr:COX15/CtaA family protein [Methylophilus sp.]HQQ32679.1 COX15/CtaA family protein [Methylophilus sp.]
MSSWFKRLSLIAAVTALCVVVLGAYVRLSDAGLGCPDWPGCYGTLTVPQSESAIAQAQTVYPDKPIDAGKAWKEMIHRYLAGALGLLVLALFFIGWKRREHIHTSPWLTTFLLGLIVFQAALGMWTVTMLLKPAIVSAHLLGGMATMGILMWIAHRHWGSFSSQFSTVPQKFWFRLALLVLFCQIFLGGWTSTNYAALACTDFPTCHGYWVPPMDFRDAFHMTRELGQSVNGGNLTLAAVTAIQWTHRIGAVITMIYLGFLSVVGLKYAATRFWSGVLMALLFVQVSLGIANLILHLPTVLAVAHNAGAAMLMATLVIINSKITASKIK